MMPQLTEEEDSYSALPPKTVAIAIVIIFIGGIVLSILGGQGVIPIDPIMTLGLSIMVIIILTCCSAALMIAHYAQRMPEYSEMENRFEEAKEQFDNEEYEPAVEIFKELAGPKMNHKRALYYGARCYEELSDWENMKIFCKAYLELKPNDKEVWEMLNRAHKRLFEYEDAEHAFERASKL
jgi:tetratricopeptide (TPR) repeat protein